MFKIKGPFLFMFPCNFRSSLINMVLVALVGKGGKYTEERRIRPQHMWAAEWEKDTKLTLQI